MKNLTTRPLCKLLTTTEVVEAVCCWRGAPRKEKRLLEKVVEVSTHKKQSNECKNADTAEDEHVQWCRNIKAVNTKRGSENLYIVVTSFQRNELLKRFYALHTRSVLLEKICH